MEFFNVLRNLRKAKSDSREFGEKIDNGCKSQSSRRTKRFLESSLPPIPNKESDSCKTKCSNNMCRNPQEDIVFGPSLFTTRQDDEVEYVKAEENLIINGKCKNKNSVQ